MKALDFLFRDADTEEAEIKQLKLLDAQRKETERELQARAKRIKELLDSPVWKDVLLIIRGLKDKSAEEARMHNSPEFLYGIDFLTKLEREIVDTSNLH